MVAPQILVLFVWVRVLVRQLSETVDENRSLFFLHNLWVTFFDVLRTVRSLRALRSVRTLRTDGPVRRLDGEAERPEGEMLKTDY